MNRERSKSRAAGRGDPGEILPEYDFSRSRPNKYASRYATGSVVVVLEPDVAAVFPSAGEANEALRALAGIIQKHRPTRRRLASKRPAVRLTGEVRKFSAKTGDRGFQRDRFGRPATARSTGMFSSSRMCTG